VLLKKQLAIQLKTLALVYQTGPVQECYTFVEFDKVLSSSKMHYCTPRCLKKSHSRFPKNQQL
jgi:hypothetical protein